MKHGTRSGAAAFPSGDARERTVTSYSEPGVPEILDTGPVLADALAMATALLQADAGAIHLVTRPGSPTSLVEYVGLSDAFVESGDAAALGALAADAARTVAVDDVTILPPPARAAAESGGFAAFASFPVVGPEGQAFGALDVYFRGRRRLAPRERRLGEAAARQLGWIAHLQRRERRADVRPPRPELPAGAPSAGLLTQLGAVLDPLPVGVFIMATDGRVVLANAEAGRVLGSAIHASPSAGGRWSGYHLDGRQLRDDEWPMSRALNHGEIVAGEDICYVGEDGVRRWVRFGTTPLHDAVGRAMGTLVTVLDVNVPQQAIERERDVARRAERLQALTAALSGAATPAAVAEVVVRDGTAALDATAGVMYERVADRVTLDLMDAAGVPTEQLDRWRSVGLSDGSPMADAVREGRAVFITDPEEMRRRYPGMEAAARVGSGSLVVLPVVLRGDAVGALAFAFQEARTFGEDERAYLRVLVRHVAEALDRARLYQDARAASQAKSDFLAVVSHELRTPLNAILGYSALIADEIPGPLNDQQHAQLGRVQASARHLLEIIEQILTLTRAETATGPAPTNDALHAGLMVDDLVELLRPRAVRQHVLLEARHDHPVDPLYTDVGRVRQILLNLLTNALKFTDRGHVAMSVHDEPDRLVFEVQDTGVGIRPEHLEHIFEPFWQADGSRTRRAQGTGLGLSVVRRLARQLGGDVTVASMPGKGSTFTFWLPRPRE